jgi:hypothetical protein
MRHRAIVCDAEHEGPLRAVAAKSRQRLPDRERDVLKEIVAVADAVRIARREPEQRRSVRGKQSMEPFVHAYVVPLAKESLRAGPGGERGRVIDLMDAPTPWVVSMRLRRSSAAAAC